MRVESGDIIKSLYHFSVISRCSHLPIGIVPLLFHTLMLCSGGRARGKY